MDAQAWDRRHAGTALLWSAEPNPLLVEAVSTLPAGRALDLGCGDGRDAVWLAVHGWRVTGVDFSPVALSKAREMAHRYNATPEWIQADLTRWTPYFSSYDLVFAAYLHLPADDRRSVLRSAAAALMPGGRLVVIGHDRAGAGPGTPAPYEPDLLYDADDLLDDLAGGPPLRVLRAGRVTRPVSAGGTRAEEIDTIVVGVRSRHHPTAYPAPLPTAGETGPGDDTERQRAAADLAGHVAPPPGYLVVRRYPTVSELRRLRTAAGLPDPGPAAAQDALDGSLAGLCVEAESEPGRAVACGRIVGDGRTFLTVVDVAVDPAVDPAGAAMAYLAGIGLPAGSAGADAPGPPPAEGPGLVAVVVGELRAWAAEQADETAFVGVATPTGIHPVDRLPWDLPAG